MCSSDLRRLPAKHPLPDAPTDQKIALISRNRRHEQHPQRQGQVHQPIGAQRTDDEHQRVSGEKGHDHQAGFNKHDQKQQTVNEHTVVLHKRFDVAVDVEDEIDQKRQEFHARIIPGASEGALP